MRTWSRIALVGLLAMSVLPSVALSHCEIPCGIYDDETRIALLKEDIATIEKSMDQIVALSAQGDKNYNQLVRWVTNKEDHANRFMETVTQYFMTQRITPVEPGETDAYRQYQVKIELLHQMLVYAMKCKQTTDKANAAKLGELVDKFSELYFHHH